MPPELPRPDSGSARSDPFRHRKEIEQMERRFRERMDRPGAEPPASEVTDDRVQEEMLQFFSESTQILAEVVPSLKQGDDALADTTGEIRRKIDAFFGDAGASGMIRAERAISPTDSVAAAERDIAAAPPRPSETQRAAPRRPQRSSTADGGAKMDLRTALERLRRHGVVRDETPNFSASGPMSGTRSGPAPELAPPPSAAEPAPLEPASLPPSPAPLEPSAARPAPFEPSSAQPGPIEPSPRFAPPAAAAPPPRDDDPFAPPTTPPPPLVARPAAGPPDAIRPRSASTAQRRPPPREAPPEPRFQSSRAPASAAPSPAVADRPTPAEHASSASSDPAEGFDAIFAEVEGLVRGTLADSVEETMEEARVGEDSMRSQQRAAAASRVQQKFAPPRDDDEDEEEEDEAPAGPYDWGVRPANQPAGAWLLQEGAEDVARSRVQERVGQIGEVDVEVRGAPASPTPKRPPTAEVARDERPSPPPPAPPSGGAAATGLLARKLEAEAERLEPIVEVLVAKGLVSADEVGSDAPDALDDDDDDDDEISVAGFVDDRPRGEAMGVTPMKIVEEIRRLRRIQEILLSKGLVSESELSASSGTDD